MGSKSYDFRKIVKAAIKQGWTVGQTAKGHWMFKDPEKRYPPIYCGGTPSDIRAIRNLVAQLRRCGFDWE